MGGDLSLETLQKNVAHAVDDFRQALTTHDFSKVLEDLNADLKQRGRQDNGFEQALDKALHDQGFLGPSGDTVHYISNVKQIDTTIGRDGNYMTVLTTSDSRTVTFTTNSDGKVLTVK